ncbi:hypothetical protein ADUPG1_013934, partial [Aduncisulcus paluster]
NGIISVATMRSGLTCPSSSLSLPAIATAMSLSSVNDISTLQGLEYGTSLTSLTLDGYDLSGDINSNAEYDRLVVQILAKAVTFSNGSGSVNSGLESLFASGCGLNEVSDVLDLTPIANGDEGTKEFKLTFLDLSNNNISDVSVLITSSIFPSDTLTLLDISDNSICDIEGMLSALYTHFSSTSIQIIYSNQTCKCSAPVSSSLHQVCREVYPDRWDVECWNGYYLDEASGECVAVCDSGYVFDKIGETCETTTSPVDDAVRVQVCEGHSTMKPVLKIDESSITCGCRSEWFDTDCDKMYQVYIPDRLFRKKVCEYAGYDINSDPYCDVSEFEMAEITGTFYANENHISTFEGAQNLINIYYFHAGNTDILSATPFSSLPQLFWLDLTQWSDDYAINILDANSLYSLHRLSIFAIFGNESIYDLSVFFKNLGMTLFSLANENYDDAIIPLCRSETDVEYQSFITSVFPIHTDVLTTVSLPNSCPLNSGGNSCTSSASCPSIVLNEVYNSVADTPVKECAFIAKTSGSVDDGDLTCYTIHDDNIRAYLSDPANGCLISSDIESNGMISVATLRSSLSCPSSSLSLSSIVTDMGISSVNSITTLQGLEYATSLTSLNIDGYDLSGDINENAEYDKLVVQILAKAVTYDSIDSGLTSLSASGCGLYAVSDVLDLTPIAFGDEATKGFKLTSLDLSNNNISDVSVLITSSIFPSDSLTFLDISGNSICDIENVVSTFQSYFTNSSLVIVSEDQSACPCSEGFDVSFSAHKTCKHRSDESNQVECWHGYYLDKNTNTCVKSCPSGYSLNETDTTGETCIEDLGSTVDNTIRCQVCERKDIFVPILDLNTSDISCGCSFGFHGDSCEYVDIPDSNLRSAVCLAVVNPSAHDSSCDDLTLSDMATVTSISASIVDSFEGLQSAVNLTSLSISGTSSSSVSIGNTDLSFLPLSLVELSLEAVYLDADSDFSNFEDLTTLSLNNNPTYEITESGLFPSTTLTSFSANNTSISLLFHLVASMPNLTELSLNNNNISDPSPLYALSNNSWSSLDLSNNYICGDEFSTQSFLATKFSTTVNVADQVCECSDSNSLPSIIDNLVCSETKPGSDHWYVVCASNSYFSYTSAEDFTCTSPSNQDGTYGCPGGCEYGHECRFAEGSDSVSCHPVIVDENLHTCVAKMFRIDSFEDYTHKTIGNDFSVASLKALVSQFSSTTGVADPVLSCPYEIITIYGIEHLAYVSWIDLSYAEITDTMDLSPLTTLTNLQYFSLTGNEELNILPDLTNLEMLQKLRIDSTSISLPSDSFLLPSSVEYLNLLDSLVDQAGFEKNVGYGHLPLLDSLYFGGTTSISSISCLTSGQKEHISKLNIQKYPIYDSMNDDIAEMKNLNTLYLQYVALETIPDLSNSAATLVEVSIDHNPNLTSLFPLSEAGLDSLEILLVSNCNISDLSPLYNLSNLWALDASYNKICVGSETQSSIDEKFCGDSLDINIEFASQTCDSSCSLIEYTSSSTPISDNKICSETKPGSSSWHIVCASDSYTSYTDAETFSCIQPTSASKNCSGGCSYGYECRYVGMDEDNGLEGECQPVIVDDVLHACVAAMFTDSVHRTDDSLPLFSVASLKTLVGDYSSETDTYSYELSCTSPIAVLSGIEHLVNVLKISIINASLPDSSLSPISTLTKLEYLNLSNNSSLTYLPDFSDLNLKSLDIINSNIILSETTEASSLLPSTLRYLAMYNTPTTQAGFNIHVCANNLPELKYLTFGNYDYISSISSVSSDLTTLGIGNTTSIQDLQEKLNSMEQLQKVYFRNIDLETIPDFSASKESLVSLTLSYNSRISSVYPLFEQGLSNLESFDCSHCSISDLSPLYPFSKLMTISVIDNRICMGSETTDVLAQKFYNYGETEFSLALGDDLSEDQTCEESCSSVANPITNNIVCSETKPGSGIWFTVCASDSYTSYTSAEDFTCISPANGDGTFGCTGGCEYGQECRYDSTSNSTSCQQVIVDDILHNVIYSLFGGSDLHCDTTDQTFGVASLKTLISVEDEDGNVSPEIYCNLGDLVSNFSGIEHVGFITKMQFYHLDISETKDLEPLSTLSNLNYLFLTDNTLADSVDPFDLPDFTGLSSLETLFLRDMPLTLPSDRYVLPSTIKELRIVCTPTVQAGFDKNVGYDYLSSLEYLQLGGENNLITSIESLSKDQLSTITGFQFADYPIYDGFNTVISEMTNLESLYLRNCNLQNIPDLSKSSATLTDLNLNLNHDITSLVPLSTIGLFSLSNISLRSCSISDLSPLYDFPNPINITSIKNNKICIGTNSTSDLIAKFTQSSVSIVLESQTCECSSDSTAIGYTDTPITDNIVCSETVPGSGSWHYVCSSHSIASYTSVNTFECLAPLNTDGETYGCSGGCEYGYECRYDDELTQSTSSCYPVIVDDNLRQTIIDTFFDDCSHYVCDAEDSLLSVASLRNIPIFPPALEGTFILSLSGLEHILNLRSLQLSPGEVSSFAPLFNLTNLQELSLLSATTLSDISFICNFPNLELLSVADSTNVSALPTCSGSNDIYSTLYSIDISKTSIIDLSPLIQNGDNNVLEILYTGEQYQTITNEDTGDTSVEYLDISSFQNLPSLRTVELDNSNMSELDFQYLLDFNFPESIDLSGNYLTDVSPIFHYNQTLTSFSFDSNDLCISSQLQNYVFESFFPFADSMTYGDSEYSETTARCCACDDSADFFMNSKCVKAWTWTELDDDGSIIEYEHWQTGCVFYSYLDSDGSCVSFLDSSSRVPPENVPPCVLESILDSHVQCSNQEGTLTSCIDGWYGEDCDQECPLVDSQQCGGSEFGTCELALHQCICNEGYFGDACEYLDSDLSEYICHDISNSTNNVSLIEGSTVICIDDSLLLLDDMQNIVSLDLSHSNISSLRDLHRATNLVELNIHGMSFEENDENSISLLELSEIHSLVSLDIGSTNIDVTSALSNIPSSILSLHLDSLDIDPDTDFSSFSQLMTLSLRYNSRFYLSSPSMLPSKISYLDLSGCVMFGEYLDAISSLSNLSTLFLSDMKLDNSSTFSLAKISSINYLDLSNNEISDISLLFQLPDLFELDILNNKLCNVTNDTLVSFFSQSDIFIDVGNDSGDSFNQDEEYCLQCGGESESIVDLSSYIVCKEIWADTYSLDCALFSYKDSSSESDLNCIGLEVGTSYSCIDGIETNLNMQCFRENNINDIITACVEGWYGDECLDECPLQGTEECGGSGYGTCDSSTHTCDCSVSGFHGDSCQYVTFADSHILSTLCSLVDGHDSTCDDLTDGDLTESDLAGITLPDDECLDLSSLDITDLSGLEYLTNIACIDLSGNTSLSNISVLDSLSEFNHLTALNISNTAVDDLTQISSLS